MATLLAPESRLCPPFSGFDQLPLVLVISTSLALPFPGLAQLAAEPLVTDRPDFTESAVTIAPGRYQLESGYTFTRVGPEREHGVGEVLLRVGLTDRLELRLGAGSLLVRDDELAQRSGLDDTSIGVKLRIAEEGDRVGAGRPGIALLAGTTLPTGSGGFGADVAQPGATLALAWTLSDRVGVASNLGYVYASDGGDRFDEFSGSVEVGYSLTERWGSYLEASGFAVGDGGTDTGFLNGGVTYLFSPDLQVDARIGAGLNGVDPDYFVGVGIARRW
ncbi:hypothetical protein BH20GEM2_BH20GEM2_21510 [soil metagenome]